MKLLSGFATALVIIGTGTILIMLFSPTRLIISQLNQNDILLSFLLFLVVSLNEELLFRGYILNNLMFSGGKYKALVLSSIIFALFHLFSFNLTYIAIINLFLSGMLLGSTYIFTQNIWFPVSLHLFWNFIQGPVFGYAVSGQKLPSIFELTPSGKNYLHGGEFGFEGSLICTILVLITILCIIAYYSKISRCRDNCI
jgi:hypothetical protein